MKYAIISDVHGNTWALSAVLKDAKGMKVNISTVRQIDGTAYRIALGYLFYC